MRSPLASAVVATAVLVAGCGTEPAAPNSSQTTALTEAPPTAATAVATAVATTATAASSTADAATPPAAGPGETLFIGPEIVDCHGEGPMKCMRTRTSPTAEWALFYQDIEGFTHEAGYEYELRVERSKVDGPPQGGSSLKYRLLEVVSKHKVDAPQ